MLLTLARRLYFVTITRLPVFLDVSKLVVMAGFRHHFDFFPSL